MKAHGKETLERAQGSNEELLLEDLRYLLTATNGQLERDFEATPLTRMSGLELKRNAIVVAGNRRFSVLAPEIEVFKDHPRIGGVAKWALDLLRS